MTDEQIHSAIAQTLRKIAPEVNLETVGPREDLRERLDIDSFDFLNFLVGLHERLGVEIPETDYTKIRTLEELTAYLRART